MRCLIASLSVAVVALAAAPAVAQAPPPDSVTQVFRQKVVPGMVDKYEAGRKKHMAWHKAQGDPWTWNTYEVTTGPGHRVLSDRRRTGHQWADLDTWTAKFGDGDTADANVSMAGTQAGSQMSYWMQLNSFSRLPPAGAPPDTALVADDLQREAGARRRDDGHDRQDQRRAHRRQLPAAQHLVPPGQRRGDARLRRGHATRQHGHLLERRHERDREATGQGRRRGAGRRSSSTTSPASRRSCCSGARTSATRRTKNADCGLRIAD